MRCPKCGGMLGAETDAGDGSLQVKCLICGWRPGRRKANPEKTDTETRRRGDAEKGGNEEIGNYVCPKCDKPYPRTEEHFTRNAAVKDGFDRYCRNCKNEMGRKGRQARLAKENGGNGRRRKARDPAPKVQEQIVTRPPAGPAASVPESSALDRFIHEIKREVATEFIRGLMQTYRIQPGELS